MKPEEYVPLLRLKVQGNGNICIPKVMRDKFGVKGKSEIVIGLFEFLEHGEVSTLPSFDVKFV